MTNLEQLAIDQLWELYHDLSFELTQEGLTPDEDRAIRKRLDTVCDLIEVTEQLKEFKEQLKL